jgi:hypothetical protein
VPFAFFPAYVPKLQSVGQVCIFVRRRRKFQIPSSTAFGKIGEAYVQAIHESAQANGIPVVQFQRRAKQRENRSSLSGSRRAPKGKDRVVLIGIAQEKASVWGASKKKGQQKAAHPHMEWGR